MNPVLSLVTGTRNRPDEFRRLVHSIQERTSVSWELIVGDASDDPITESYPHVIMLPENPRLGCTKGYNRAFKETRGKWVIWLNDDAEVQPGYAEAAIRFMETHPQIGLGALYYSDTLTREGYHVNTCCYGMVYANFGILSRELGEQVGWFDEILPMYGNDNSLAFRVLLAGKGIAGIPDARIIHHSEDDLCRRQNNNNREQDSYTLKNKYGPHLKQMREVYDAALNLVNA